MSFSHPSLRQEDLEFARNARDSIRGDRVVGANLLLWLIFGSIVAAVGWAAKANVDEVTRGVGQVVPSSSIQTVQNLEGGIVSEILVTEGAIVKQGDVLIKIDDTLSSSTFRENLTRRDALEAKLARLAAQARGQRSIKFPELIAEKRPELVKRENELFAKQYNEIVKQRQTVATSQKLAQEELEMTRPLVAKNIVPKVEQLRLERELNELNGKMEELVDGFQRLSMQEYNEAKAEYEGLVESLEGRQDRVDRTMVRSPVEGIVNKIHVRTIGGVIQPGEPIMDIVPHADESLVVEAKISPADIAFLRPGQEAVVKLTAYDFAIYGGLQGEVVQISADTIEDEVDGQRYYIVKVRNKEGEVLAKDGEELPVIPGMVAQVDVLTGRRTVLQYLTKPFHRMRLNALTER